MPANFLHGVETIEVSKGARPARQIKTAVIGLVGTAPMHDIAAAEQKVNECVLVASASDAVRYFGSAKTGYTIPQALDAMLDHGGIALVVNVLDPASHVTNVVSEARTLGADDTLALANEGVSSVVVEDSTDTTTYVLGTDYSIDLATGVITRIGAGTIAALATLHITYDYLDPSLIVAGDIIGTDGGAGARTGLQALQEAWPLYGFDPKILIAPGYGTATAVATELDILADKFRAVALVDAPAGTTYTDAISGRGPIGTINFYTSSDRMILCFPHLKRYDPATDTEVLEPYSQRLAGLMAKSDLDNGYWHSPSNREIKGITGAEIPIIARINDPTSEANLLNEAGIVTIFMGFGTGIRSFGNRSASWPTSTDPLNFIAIRRVADVVAESLEQFMLQYLDRPINRALIDSVLQSADGFIRTLIGRHALVDGKVQFLEEENPTSEFAAGHLTFNIDLMPPPPLERVTFKQAIDTRLLAGLYS